MPSIASSSTWNSSRMRGSSLQTSIPCFSFSIVVLLLSCGCAFPKCAYNYNHSATGVPTPKTVIYSGIAASLRASEEWGILGYGDFLDIYPLFRRQTMDQYCGLSPHRVFSLHICKPLFCNFAYGSR